MANIVSLSEAASIALHSMVLIAQSDKVLNVAEISEKICSSRHHVAKVMQHLAKQGLVSSSRGPNGGFSLKKPAERISLLDIYETIDGKMDFNICPGNTETCPFHACILGDITTKVTLQIKDFFETQKLSDYI